MPLTPPSLKDDALESFIKLKLTGKIMTKTPHSYLEFVDKKLERRMRKEKIPMETFYEAYFAGGLDIKGNIFDFLRARQDFVQFKLTTGHLKWAVTNFIPEVAIHTKKQDTRIVREHYDRGNDFFGWFLGERMVYTAAFFTHPGQSLEEAQDNKLNRVCQKLQLEPGDTFLDIGCGWGTLARHAAKHYGAISTGVTLSKNQTQYGNEQIARDGLAGKAEILCLDYRDTPKRKFKKIASLEMVEHVGVRNLQSFYDQVYGLLEDDGIFLLQWAGLRSIRKPEDLIWGLFMNRHVFPGADASLPPFAMLKTMHKSQFEVHSMENVTIHYSVTLNRWHDNWVSNRAEIVRVYGDRWYRIWNFFLAWSTIIAEQGNAACFQTVLNKNNDHFNRTRYIGAETRLGARVPEVGGAHA
jgi:cyclopropane fatty-acyl-phospholipid synthase-like methyltransferase